jgi:transposase-like protein
VRRGGGVVKAVMMKITTASGRTRSPRTDATRRAQVLAEFDRSGLSAAAFAREHGLNYTTFCGWRQRRDKTKLAPAFIEVELPAPTAPVELVIEVGAHARLRVHCESQIALAARLLQKLSAAPC